MQIGDVYIKAQIIIEGHINGASLYDMTAAEWLADIIDAGIFEFEVLSDELRIENVEEVDE